MQTSLALTEENVSLSDCRDLPDGWRWIRLCQIINRIESGTSVNANDRTTRNGETGVLKLSCVRNGVFEPTEHKTVLPQEIMRVSAPVRGGTIIMSRKNTVDLVGANAYSPVDIPNLYLSDLLWQLHISTKEVNPKWLAYLLASPEARQRISAQASGTSHSMKNIVKEQVLALTFAFPPLDEQARIVEILNAANEAIRATESLIEAKIRYKHALAEQLLTGKRPFPEFAGQIWRQYHLGDLFSERIEIDRSDLKLLAVTSTEGIIERDLLAKRDTSSEDKSKYLRVAPGDIAYNTMRMWQGVFGLSSLEGIVSPAYTVCTPNERIVGRFAAYLFKLPAIIALFHRYSQGLVSDTLNLKFPAFAQIKVTIPALPEQRRIADMLGLLDEEINLLRVQLTAQQKLKQGLMQKLLTGQVRTSPPAPLLNTRFAGGEGSDLPQSSPSPSEERATKRRG